MKPRRGLPEPEPTDFDETDLEISAVRRGLWLDEAQDPQVPRRASRAAADEPDSDEADLTAVDLAPSRAASAVDEAAPSLPAEPGVPQGQVAPGASPAVDAKPAPKSSGASKATGKPRPETKPAEKKRTAPAKPPGEPTIGKPTQPLPPAERRWRIGVIGATVLGLAAAFGVSAVPAEAPPLPQTVPLITALSRICPVSDATPSSLRAISSTGQIRTRTIAVDGQDSHPSPLALSDLTSPIVISPDDSQASVTGGSLIYTGEQAWWGLCRSSLADQYVQLPGGADAKLRIVNPDPDAALIDITLSGPQGEITGDGLRGLTIAPNSQQVIDLAPLAGSVDAVGARIRSSVGRVVATGELSRPEGGDFAGSTVQGSQLVIAGIPEGATKTQLVLTNPGTNRNVVKIETIGQAGRSDLPGFESYALDAQRSVAIDLTAAIGGLPVGLLISGRDEFAATAVVQVGNDIALEPALTDDQSIARQDLVGVLPGEGIVQIVNPGADEAMVVVDWGPGQAQANRTINPGSVASIEVPAGAGQVRLTSTTPISAVVMIAGSNQPGFAVGLLQAAARSRSSMPMELEPGLGR